jgi:anti-sigma28 factor (negative regulator of flagellin synthesis)
MRVNDPNPNPAALNPNGPAGAGAAGAGAAGTGATGKTAQLDPVRISSSSTNRASGADRTDEVQLSSLSSKINDLQSDSPQRAAYLESLRLEVASGQYEADPAQTASAIVKDALIPSE